MIPALPEIDSVIRFVRFVPGHLSSPDPELEQWIAAQEPRGVGRGARCLWRHNDAAKLNERYERTLVELGKCRLKRKALLNLWVRLVREGDAAIEWYSGRASDRYEQERKDEDDFLAHVNEAAHAARTLARIFGNSSSLANWTAAFALAKGMTERPDPDWPEAEAETAPLVTPWPFVSWRIPVIKTGGAPRMADHLVALMERLAHECDKATAGGYHRFRYGPFYFPPGNARPRKANELMINGALYIAVRAARQATGAVDLRCTGAPMPKGGRPLYRLAAAYVWDVTKAAHPRGLGRELSAVNARERLTKLLRRSPRLECRGWAADQDR